MENSEVVEWEEMLMPKYVIERNMPGAGALSHDDLAAIAEKSCSALEEIGSHIQWVESFVTADKVYSVYIARDQRLIREHAKEHDHDLAQCFAYSDSYSDVPMLSVVGHPAAVNPDLKLRRLAQAYGWPVISL